MLSLSSIFLRLSACIEIALFIFYAIYGAHGIRTIHAIGEQTQALEQKTHLLEEEVEKLQTDISQWNSYPFFKEQYAREHLQMAHKNDELYLI